jgi:hypothetical protein
MARTRSAISVADGVIHHGAGDAGVQAEAIGQVGGAVELAAADVDLAFGRLAERDDARVQTIHQRAQREEIQRAVLTNIQASDSSIHFSTLTS